MAVKIAASETNETKFEAVRCKLPQWSMFDNFPFDEEYENVAETDIHENPKWPPYEPHGIRFDLGTPKSLELDTIKITENVG